MEAIQEPIENFAAKENSPDVPLTGERANEMLPGMIEKPPGEATKLPEEQGATVKDADVEKTPDPQDGPKEAARVFNVSYTVRAGGAVLAFVAGTVNSVAFYALSRFASHLTGSWTKVGLGLEDSEKADAGDSVLLVISFVIGSILTGFLIAKDTVHFGMALYDICLLCETALLILATITHEDTIARYLAAAACGLQNGMATHWGGAVIRTTHVTGLFTDVGLLIGRLSSIFCRKRCGAKFDDFDRAFVEDDISKLSVLSLIATFFLIGVYSGAKFYNGMKEKAFLIPASITGTIGLTYSIYRVVILHQSFFSDAEMEMIDVPVQLQEDAEDVVGDIPRRQSSLGSVNKIASSSSDIMCVSRSQATAIENARGLNLHHQP